MIHTIATTESTSRELILDISTSGNKYTVGIWDKVKHECTSNTYDSIEDAYEVYEKISKCFVMGLYKDEELKAMIRR